MNTPSWNRLFVPILRPKPWSFAVGWSYGPPRQIAPRIYRWPPSWTVSAIRSAVGVSATQPTPACHRWRIILTLSGTIESVVVGRPTGAPGPSTVLARPFLIHLTSPHAIISLLPPSSYSVTARFYRSIDGCLSATAARPAGNRQRHDPAQFRWSRRRGAARTIPQSQRRQLLRACCPRWRRKQRHNYQGHSGRCVQRPSHLRQQLQYHPGGQSAKSNHARS